MKCILCKNCHDELDDGIGAGLYCSMFDKKLTEEEAMDDKYAMVEKLECFNEERSW